MSSKGILLKALKRGNESKSNTKELKVILVLLNVNHEAITMKQSFNTVIEQRTQIKDG